MSASEQTNGRLEQAERGGIAIPWGHAGMTDGTPRDGASGEVPRPVPAPPPTHASAPVGAEASEASQWVPAPWQAAARQRVDLDLDRLKRMGWLETTHLRSPLVEEFRQIKRPLLRHARTAQATAGRLSLIMVTSACPGEGKTFTAINLALSMAMEIDTAVLLVDADVIHADLPERLGFQDGKGLLDLLTDPRLKWPDLVLETNVPKLSILPAGTRSGVSTELLASDAMEALLVALAATGPEQIVIFDAPPLLVASEAKVLAARMGQVLLVVEACATPRRAVAQAFAELERCPIVMSMLNKTPEPSRPHPYGP